MYSIGGISCDFFSPPVKSLWLCFFLRLSAILKNKNHRKISVLRWFSVFCFQKSSPYGIRTRVTRMKTWGPNLTSRTDHFLLGAAKIINFSIEQELLKKKLEIFLICLKFISQSLSCLQTELIQCAFHIINSNKLNYIIIRC